MSYPTEGEVIRELIDTSHSSFEQGYAAGRNDIIQELEDMIMRFDTKWYSCDYDKKDEKNKMFGIGLELGFGSALYEVLLRIHRLKLKD